MPQGLAYRRYNLQSIMRITRYRLQGNRLG